MDGFRIEDGQTRYELGSTIDLALQLDTEDALSVGETLSVEIRDVFDNVIDTVVAEQIGGNLYVAEWTVRTNLPELYNPSSLVASDLTLGGDTLIIGGETIQLYDYTGDPADESIYDNSVYVLKDVWMFPDATVAEFPFYVSRAPEKVISDNSIYTLEISGINNSDSTDKISFMSKLSKYYAPIDDVVAVSSTALEGIDTYSIVKQVMIASEYVDNHMRPNIIVNKAAFDSAVRCFVRHMAAASILKEELKVDSESKQLDTFQIRRDYNSKRFLDDIENKAYACALVIWAGGNDTPFTTKRFQKGIFDPNRPNVSRANLDISGSNPWVNITSQPVLIPDASGDLVEIRGTRTIKLPSSEQRYLL